VQASFAMTNNLEVMMTLDDDVHVNECPVRDGKMTQNMS
jgi:hypothetical protein